MLDTVRVTSSSDNNSIKTVEQFLCMEPYSAEGATHRATHNHSFTPCSSTSFSPRRFGSYILECTFKIPNHEYSANISAVMFPLTYPQGQISFLTAPLRSAEREAHPNTQEVY